VLRRSVAVAAVAVLALSGCTGRPPAPAPTGTPTPASTAPVVFGLGADGLGDSYFPKAGNGGYDVSGYDLDVAYEPKTDKLTGTAIITAVAVQDLARFNLDFKDLAVDSATVDGTAAETTSADEELVVTPAKGIVKGATFVVKIAYSGVPQPYREPGLGEIGFLHTDDGAIAIGEPQVAASWYPVNDHPRDKATYTIKVTAPDGLAALSNGALQGKKSSAGKTTWTWVETKPMASYLATVVIGKYRVKESTHDGMPVVTAVDSRLSTQVDAQLARSGEVVDFLESRFGPYPFDALGGIAISDPRVRFALENQTRPIYSSAFFTGGDAMWVIVHELAHQWFGDSVSVNDWKEIWLNEGFATYAEWLWSEAKGTRTAQAAFDGYYAQTSSSIWSVPPGDPGADDLFGSSVYNRGGMVLHALRIAVGDTAFFTILKNWAAEKANGNATTPEFVALAERVSGKQLDSLFQAWVYGKKRPPRPTPAR
jgi:aminopeptidase N